MSVIGGRRPIFRGGENRGHSRMSSESSCAQKDRDTVLFPYDRIGRMAQGKIGGGSKIETKFLPLGFRSEIVNAPGIG